MCPPFLPHDSSPEQQQAPGMPGGCTLCSPMNPRREAHSVSKAGKGRPWIKNTVYEWQGGQQGLIVLPSETRANPIAGLEW